MGADAIKQQGPYSDVRALLACEADTHEVAPVRFYCTVAGAGVAAAEAEASVQPPPSAL